MYRNSYVSLCDPNEYSHNYLDQDAPFREKNQIHALFRE